MVNPLLDDCAVLGFDDDYEVYVESLEDSASHYIIEFFRGKSFHCGGPIPARKLLSESSVNLVLSTPFCDGVDECHSVMPHTEEPEDYCSNIAWDINCFLELLTEVKAHGVPKQFQAGLILLYYKFCKGCNVAEKARNLTHITG